MPDLALYAISALAISTGLAGIICAGFPPRANHSRIWKQAQLEREIRDQLANCESPAPTMFDPLHVLENAR